MISDIFGNRVIRYAILAGLGLGLLINPSIDLKRAEGAQVAVVNVDKLNLRSGPGTQNGFVGQAKKGEQLAVITKKGDWYQIQVGGKTAWAAGWLVSVQEVPVPSRGKAIGSTSAGGQVAVVKGNFVNVRSGPGTNYGLVGKVKQGDRMTITGQKGDWYKVQSGNTGGWVANWLITVQNNAASTAPAKSSPASGGKVALVNASILNIRSGPGTGFVVAGKAKQGEKLTVIEQSGDWYKIQAGNLNGWVAGSLVSVQSTPAVSTPAPVTPSPVTGTQLAVINADNLNLRSGPGTSHNVAGQVSRGLRLPVVSRSGDWVQVRQNNGSNAWVAGWMVSVVDQPEPTQPAPSSNDWLPAPASEPQPQPGQNEPAVTKPEYVPEAKLVDVKVNEENDHTYINITSDKKIDYNTFMLSNPFRYVINIKDVQLNEVPEILSVSTGLVDKVRTGVFSKDPYIVRLVVDLKQGARVKASLSSDKKSLTLDIGKISYSDGLQGKTIFLDAGHGGKDNGASGANGLREKDANLGITFKVADILRKQGASVVFSRSEDLYVDLYERTRMANEQNADIFVSIHSNANTNPGITGTSTYYYAPSSVPQLYDQYSDRQRLAEDVQRELIGALGRRDIGVLQSNFAVLRTSVMPSILIETAFVSNGEEEALLASDDFRQRAAEAIAKGIGAYFSGK